MDNRRAFLVSLWLLLLCGHLKADGGFFAFDQSRWRQVDEKQQTCLISYNAGQEKMLLAVKLDTFHSTKAVWVFPVPSSPDQVRMDVVGDLPEFSGVSARVLGHQTIARMFSVMAMSQIYPIPFMSGAQEETRDGGYGAVPASGMPLMGGYGWSDVEVYGHVEKLGLTTELIAARDKDAPYAYLKAKGLDLPEEARTILGDYVGENYSFVVSWISDTAQFKPDTSVESRDEPRIGQVAVSVTFPADSIYFPLKLTKVYGQVRVPIELNVLGDVTPELDTALRPFSKIEFNLQNDYEVPLALTSFFNDQEHVERLRYTTITINAPAKHFTQDLRIRNIAPHWVSFADWLHRSFLILVLVAFTIATLLASILSAAAAFRNDRAARLKFSLLGLLNFMTLAGVLVGTALVRTRPRGKHPETAPQGFRSWDLRKLVYAVLFTFLFMAITLLFSLLLRTLV